MRKEMIKMVMGFLFLILLIGGAIGVPTAPAAYTQPGKTPQQITRDTRDCEMNAQQMGHARRARGQSILDFRESDYFDECMREKGYVPSSR